MKYCRYCGSEVNDAAIICVNCGKLLSDSSFGQYPPSNSLPSANKNKDLIKIGILVIFASKLFGDVLGNLFGYSILCEAIGLSLRAWEIIYKIKSIIFTAITIVGIIFIFLGCSKLDNRIERASKNQLMLGNVLLIIEKILSFVFRFLNSSVASSILSAIYFALFWSGLIIIFIAYSKILERNKIG